MSRIDSPPPAVLSPPVVSPPPVAGLSGAGTTSRDSGRGPKGNSKSNPGKGKRTLDSLISFSTKKGGRKRSGGKKSAAKKVGPKKGGAKKSAGGRTHAQIRKDKDDLIALIREHDVGRILKRVGRSDLFRQQKNEIWEVIAEFYNANKAEKDKVRNWQTYRSFIVHCS